MNPRPTIFLYYLLLSFFFQPVCGQVITLGSGTTNSSGASPVNPSSKFFRCQILYTAAELKAAGAQEEMITHFGFYVSAKPNKNLKNYTIKMRHTSGNLSSHIEDGFTQVFYQANYSPLNGTDLTEGYATLTLNTPFYWNGVDNLIVDVCFSDVPAPGNVGTLRTYNSVGSSYRKITSTTENVCESTTSSPTSVKPQCTITLGNYPGVDAAVTAIQPGTNTFAPGQQPVTVTVTNEGGEAIANPTLNWTVNEVAQAAYTYPGTIAVGESASVTVGEYDFLPATTYSIAAEVAYPGDTITNNNSIGYTNLRAGISGNYTIGGSGATNFATFTAAANALAAGGVTGPVVIDIADGTYQEYITLNHIPGTSATNTVTFRSQSGDKTAVTVTHPATGSSTNAVVNLNGADYLVFENLTFVTTKSLSLGLIAVQDSATHNRFIGNTFRGNTGNTASDLVKFRYNAFTSSHNQFVNNEFIDGNKGIDFSTNPITTLIAGTVVEKNTFTGQKNGFIHLAYQQAPIVRENTMSTAVASGANGIYLSHCHAFTVERNKLSVTGSIETGISIYEAIGTDTERGLIVNNFVYNNLSTDNFSAGTGIEVEGSEYVDVLFNSVKIEGDEVYSEALLTSTSYLRVKNNILANYAGGLAWVTFADPEASDHNDFYTTGTNLLASSVNEGGTTYRTLASWRTHYGTDANSISVDPQFVAADDLHTVNGALNAMGTPVAGVTTDIDGEPRDATTPDIGADEYNASSLNAGMVNLVSPTAPFAPGTQPIKVTIENAGSEPLSSLTVNWQINESEVFSYTWSDANAPLAPQQQREIEIGSFDFQAATRYTLTIWSLSPNGGTDEFTNNDTLTVTNKFATLAGTFTIGATNADFASPTDAVDNLNLGGVSGGVVLNIQAGTYTGALSLGPIPGASDVNPIVFQSAAADSTQVKLSFTSTSSQESVLELNGADYITFKHLTIEALDYANAINVRDGATHNTFGGNIITGVNGTLVSSENPTGNDVLDENNTFQHSLFKGGDKGIVFKTSGGTVREAGNVIKNNVFEGQTGTGLKIEDQDYPIITGNVIKADSLAANYVFGMDLDNCRGTETNYGLIANNFVYTGNQEAMGGIRLRYGSFLHIYHNTVHAQTSGDNYVFEVFNTTDLAIKNNIFVNSGSGYVVNNWTEATIVSDYNNLYTTGANLSNTIATLADWQATGKDANSVSVDPLFFSADSYYTGLEALDNAGTPLAEVTQDIAGKQRNTATPDIGAYEFSSTTNDIGITNLTGPTSGCGVKTEKVNIVITNFGSNAVSNFNVGYTLTTTDAVIETISATLNPGAALTYTFSQPVTYPAEGSYTIRAFTSLTGDQVAENDTVATPLSVTILPPVGEILSMSPANGSVNINVPLTFSWSFVTEPEMWDLYLWQGDSTVLPATPLVQNLEQSYSYTYEDTLSVGATYNWTIVSKNATCFTKGPVQQFTTITDLPDLIVESFEAPEEAVAGQTVTLRWKVKNVGSGSTGNTTWEDNIYLATDADLDAGSVQTIKTVSNVSALLPGQSYQQEVTYQIPKEKVGSFYLYVTTDDRRPTCVPAAECTPAVTCGEDYRFAYSRGDVREAGEDYFGYCAYPSVATNNFQSGSIAITPALLPDLTPVYANVPEAAFGGATINVSYGVKNVGVQPAQGNQVTVGNVTINSGTGSSAYQLKDRGWTDNIYISDSAVFTSSARLLAQKPVRLRTLQWNAPWGSDSTFVNTWNSLPDYLAVDSMYTIVHPVTIPVTYYGKYYIHVRSDASNQVGEINATRANNTLLGDSIDVILNPTADLVVSTASVSADASSGQPVTVAWTVENNGVAKANRNTWTDEIYLSQVDTFYPDSVQFLASQYISIPDSLPAGQNYSRTKQVTLPEGIEGSYYLYVKADAYNNVFEFEADANNFYKIPFNVTLSPAPDLICEGIIDLDTVQTQNPAPLQIQIKNVGAAAVAKPYSVAVYLVVNGQQQSLATVPVTNFTLASGATTTIPATLPSSLLAPYLEGTYQLVVKVDAANAVYEGAGESNNTLVSPNFYLKESQPADLQVSQITAPESVNSGTSLSIGYSLVNNGPTSLLFDNNGKVAYARVYLSKDTVLSSGSDIYLGNQSFGDIAEGATVTKTLQAVIPDSCSGPYYVLVQADYLDNIVNDNVSSNNTGYQAIDVIFSPPADLVLTDSQVPESVFAGQSLYIPYTLTNEGTGNATKPFRLDAVLTYSPTSSVYDQQLIGVDQITTLGAGETITDSVLVTIPTTEIGTLYLGLKVNEDKKVFELNRGNNTSSTIVTILPPPATDLIVTDVSTPANSTLGDSISIAVTVKNNLTTKTYGTLKNGAFISADTEVDTGVDKLLGAKEEGILSLNGGQSLTRTFTGRLTDINPGAYYGVGLTNMLNSVVETNITNNSLASQSFEVTVPTLALDVEQNLMVRYRDYKYYRIEVGQGYDLVIDLSSNVAVGNNRLFVAYNKVPTDLDFDFKNEAEAGTTQRVLVPNTQAGVYYLLIQSEALSEQTASVLARALPFSVLAVSPGKVGQGVVTTVLQGAGFRTDSRVFLKQGDAAVAEGIVKEYKHSMEIAVRWDLKDVALGVYDLEVENSNGEKVVLAQAVEVQPSTGYIVEEIPIVPESVRRGQATQMAFKYVNKSNIDIPVLKGSLKTHLATDLLSASPLQGRLLMKEDFNEYYKENKENLLIEDSLYYAVPFLVRNFKPAEEVIIAVQVNQNAGNSLETIQFASELDGLTDSLFFNALATKAHLLREFLLDVQYELKFDTIPGMTETLNDPAQFMASVLAPYFTSGFITAADTAGFNLTCSSCYVNLTEADQLAANLKVAPGDLPLAAMMTTAAVDEPIVIDGDNVWIGTNEPTCQDVVDATADAVRLKGDLMKKGIERAWKASTRTGGLYAKWSTKYNDNSCNDKVIITGVTDVISSVSDIGVFKNPAFILKDLAIAMATITLKGYNCDRIAAGKPPVPIFDQIADGLRCFRGGSESAITISVVACGAKLFCGKPAAAAAAEIPVLRSMDPNEIAGPEGFGPERFVSVQDSLPYKVYFENDSAFATAPAQRVKVTVPLGSKYDLQSFKVGNFGFGPYSFTAPANALNYTTTLNLQDSLGFNVEVTAGLDIVKKEAFWLLQSIDPVTGAAPTSATTGFLPINDSTGRGEGYVQFSIRPAAGLQTGDTVSAKASIVFDINDAIETNTAFNTIDAVAPTKTFNSVNVSTFAEEADSAAFLFTYTLADDTTGSGPDYLRLLVSKNGGDYTLYNDFEAESQIVYYGNPSDSLCFKSLLVDHAGNVSALTDDVCLTYLAMVSPVHQSVDNPTTLDIVVNPVDGATTYTIELSESPLFEDTVLTLSDTVNVFAVSSLEPGKVYYVRAKCDKISIWGEVRSFTTENAAARISQDETDALVKKEATIYPNPSDGFYTIQLPKASESVEVKIRDVLGNIVYRRTFKAVGKAPIRVYLPTKSGFYTVETNTDDGVFNNKIIKK